jgi:hypothetical protein
LNHALSKIDLPRSQGEGLALAETGQRLSPPWLQLSVVF